MESGQHKAIHHQPTALLPLMGLHQMHHGSTSISDKKESFRQSWLSIEKIAAIKELSVQTFMWATTVRLLKTLHVALILNQPASIHAMERLASISDSTKMFKVFFNISQIRAYSYKANVLRWPYKLLPSYMTYNVYSHILTIKVSSN
jgi:hypothetical protein